MNSNQEQGKKQQLQWLHTSQKRSRENMKNRNVEHFVMSKTHFLIISGQQFEIVFSVHRVRHLKLYESL